MKVSIVGTGYVGLVTGAVFSEIGHTVLCVDNDEEKIDRLRNLEIPIYEEGLEEMVARNVAGNRLSFSSSIEEATNFAEVIFIAVGTPPGYRGEPDMSYVETVGRTVAGYMTDYRLLVEKSTVPVNTSEQLKRTVRKHLTSDIPYDVASNPEFLREGSAIHDALHPDRIVVGVDSENAAALLREIYEPIVSSSKCPYLEMNIASAELTKHASNSFLAMKISFINAVSRICELAGADVIQVAEGMGLDKRINPHFLRAGVGYGGSCFPKDVDAFVRLGEELGYPLNILKEVQKINADQKEHLFQKLKDELWVLSDKTIAIWGLAFKPGTDDVRESPALYFVDKLHEQNARLKLWDPVGATKFDAVRPGFSYFDTPLACAENADAVLILTNWPEITGIDLSELRTAMTAPIVVDGRNVFSPNRMNSEGFVYHSIGRPSASSKSRIPPDCG